ncbi:YceI family protein [Parasulfitobacter algicola]|uniref:YceI family protein n=1 Tax=Parasulfitobacter algicola TaxID=2614809 RepID=A0ABX2ITL9_9RHOB|nr:YceI family protein [Sulfitobacter algicola]NSX54415.1 YceI family protein [Sulfitobacter algicola]
MKQIYAALGGVLLSTSAVLGWTLDGDASAISYVSIKNAETAEPNLLPGLTGMIADDGAAQIDIALSSVETYIDIRNERMQEHLFKVATYPIASLSAQLDMAQFADMAAGATMDVEFPVTVASNGQEASYDVMAAVTRVGDDRVAVSSRQPVILYADELGYAEGLATLQEIAGLDSIQLAVPVSFTLVFDNN